MPRTLLPGEEPPARSPSPDDSKALIDSADEEESDEDEADGFEMMATVKAEPADEDSASDDEEEQDAPSQDDAASTNSAALCSNDFKLVWDTGKLERTYDKEGKKVWHCRFCGTSRSGWNHTKAKGHVLGGKDVKICTNIPPKWAVIFRNYDMRLKSAQATRDEELSRIEVERIQKEEVALAVYNVDKDLRLARRNPKKKPVPEVDLTAESPGVDSALTSVQRPTPFAAVFDQRSSSEKRQSVSQESSLSSRQKKKKPKVYQQSSLVTTFSKNAPETERQLSLAINRLCIVYGITNRMPSSSHFKAVLNYARQTNSSYKPPTVHEMGGGLLEANYFAYQLESVNKLLTKVDIFGLGVFGDGATIVKTPMMNVLACSAGNPHCVLQVVDCSSHCAKGEKKDAFYVCQQMLPKMREIDPERKHFDLIAFDGAANVQKAGSLINQYFPRCSVIVGLEHTVSLICGKVCTLTPVKEFCRFAKNVSY